MFFYDYPEISFGGRDGHVDLHKQRTHPVHPPFVAVDTNHMIYVANSLENLVPSISIFSDGLFVIHLQ